jgi:hypothetical protein
MKHCTGIKYLNQFEYGCEYNGDCEHQRQKTLTVKLGKPVKMKLPDYGEHEDYESIGAFKKENGGGVCQKQ